MLDKASLAHAALGDGRRYRKNMETVRKKALAAARAGAAKAAAETELADKAW